MTLEEAANIMVDAMGTRLLNRYHINSWAFWGTVWNWAKGEEWWIEFLFWLSKKAEGGIDVGIPSNYINCSYIGSPDFLIELAEFLEGRK